MRGSPILPPAERATRALEQVLPPGVILESSGMGWVLVRGTPLVLRWVGEGWPSDVRKHTEEDLEGKILAARHFSKGARRILRSRGIGWVDETGGAEILAGPVVISRAGDPEVAQRPQVQRWTSAVTTVAEAILCGESPTVASIVKATGLSQGGVAKALRFLTAEGLLEQDEKRGRRSGRRLRDPHRLLDLYAEVVSENEAVPQLELGVIWDDVVEGMIRVGRSLSEHGVFWACTSALGAHVLAPYLTTIATAEVYVDATTLEGLRGIADQLNLRPVEGGRLILRPVPTKVTRAFAESRGDLVVAPWPRVFADLRSYGVRGEDAAEHLREVYLES